MTAAKKFTEFTHIKSELLGGKVKLVNCDDILDERGSLTPIHFQDLGFDAHRMAIIQSFNGASRGGHAHKEGSQLLVCTSGSVTVELRHAGQQATVLLKPGDNALLISAPVWARQTYHGASPSLVLVSDVPFHPENYLD